MAHPYKQHKEVHAGRKRAHEMSKHFKRGGAAKHDDEAEDKKLIKKEISKHGKHADMKAEGGKVHKRLARGGRAKAPHHTHINIMVAPRGGNALPAGAGGPPISPVGGAAGPPPMPPPGLGGPPGMPPKPPMMPPGGPPGMGGPPMMRKRGGRTGMKYGAGSGEGREEKAKKYGGKKAKNKDE